MSYKCQSCTSIVEDYTPIIRKVIKTRNKIYYHLVTKHPLTHKKSVSNFNSIEERNLAKAELLTLKYEILKDFVTKGSEIAKEIAVCNNCR